MRKLLLVAALLGQSATGGVVDEWTFRNPSPSPGNLFNGAYGNGTYVILSRGSMVHRTTDFISWSSVPLDLTLENVIFADGMFMASGSNGEILRSSDGESWTVGSSNTTAVLPGLAYGGGRYVVTGGSGTTSTSTDGQNWTPGSTGDGNWYGSAAFGEGRFVAVSGAGTIMTSTDGENWSPATLDVSVPEGPEFYVVAYGAGRFLVGGYYSIDGSGVDGALMLSSEDGLAFSLVSDPAIPNASAGPERFDGLKWDGSRFIAAGDNGLLLSSNDGLAWTVLSSNTTTDLYAVVPGGELTALLGRRGLYVVSQDLVTWTPSEPLDGLGYLQLNTIVHDGSRFLLGGFNGAVRSSIDGLTWNPVAHPGSGSFTRSAQGGGRWVLASSQNTDGIPLITSPDATAWSVANVPAGTSTCSGVAHGNGRFVASVLSGPNLLLVSDNGVDWTGVDPPDLITCRGVAHGGGKFVTWTLPDTTSGDPIRVAVSSDGDSWDVHDTPASTGSIFDAAYGGGRWVFVGANGLVLSTTDFGEWQQQALVFDLEPVFGTPEAEPLDSVAYGNGHWVIIGRRHQFWSSMDGLSWTQAFTSGLGFPGDRLYDLIFVDGHFWACGSDGSLVQSGLIEAGVARGPVFLSIRKEGSSQVELVVTGQSGDQWNLMFSPVLPPSSAELKAQFTLGAMPFAYPDSLDPGGRGFYWIEEPSPGP